MHSEFALAKKLMHWINRAETKFGHLAIPGLLRYVAGFNALCYVLVKLNPHFLEFLYLDRGLILQGQVWRLITFIFIPSIGGFFPDWLGAALYILYIVWIGDALEQAMGEFRVTLFYLLGIAGSAVAAFIANADSGGSLLNATLLFAMARYYPDNVIYVMFILPVKIKWMAWFTAALVTFSFLGGSWGYRAASIAALSNFFIFFGRDLVDEARHRHEVAGRRRRFDREVRATDEEAMHQCAVCGRTELVAPDLEFRVSKDGQEYCTEHLPKPTPSS
jgi:hypothetical protein